MNHVICAFDFGLNFMVGCACFTSNHNADEINQFLVDEKNIVIIKN